MATAKLNYSTQANIEETPYTEGAIYVATDSNRVYVDLDGSRKLLSDGKIKLVGDVVMSSTEPSDAAIWVKLKS